LPCLSRTGQTQGDAMPREFGDVDGVAVGTVFASRADLAAAGVHKPIQAGISGAASEGSDSIVVSGGYEDDEDYGDLIVYTGHGGNDPATRRQVADQEWVRGNRALARNCDEGLPVRVVRGAHGGSPYAPPSGYRYDGLYRVDSYWTARGHSGFQICRFRLVRDTDPVPELLGASDEAGQPVLRVPTTVQRIARNSDVAQRVKDLYDHACQACGTQLRTPAGPYAEAAHIRPLGRPHDGPDEMQNVLCLCPNHHVLIDAGSFSLHDDLTIISHDPNLTGRLRITEPHRLGEQYLAYHRSIHGYEGAGSL
jgi:putative restriction endonuclease